MRTYGIYGEMDFRKESINSVCQKLMVYKDCGYKIAFHCGKGIAFMLKAILKGLEIHSPIYIDYGIRDSDIIIIHPDNKCDKIEVHI